MLGQTLLNNSVLARKSAKSVRNLAAALLLATMSSALAATMPLTGLSIDAGGSVIITAPGAWTQPPRWQYNGIELDRIGYSLRIDNLQPGHAGLYAAVAIGATEPSFDPFILGVGTSEKIIGYGTEVGADILHPNERIYDQMLLQGAAATITADPGQVSRISFVDLNDDIVQVEFSGAGTLSLWLDGVSGPAAPELYHQAVPYIKGHASIVITGADRTTNATIFTVGRMTAVNQGLFKAEADYDGVADVAFVAIQSTDGLFGALRTGNAHFYATRGLTGIYAPGVTFTRPIYVHNMSAYDTATPVFLIGAGSDVRVNGGDMAQPNNRAVKVSGITQLKFMNGTDSHGNLLPAKANLARYEQNGVDVTAWIVAEVFISSAGE